MTKAPKEEVSHVPTMEHKTDDGVDAVEVQHKSVFGEMQNGTMDMKTGMEDSNLHVEMSAVDEVYLRKV